MNTYDFFITLSGWEDRFVSGAKRFIDNNVVKSVIIFSYKEYDAITNNNTVSLTVYAVQRNIPVTQVIIEYSNPVNSWKLIKENVDKIHGQITIDISTMPRNIIYSLLFHADNSNCISSIYCMYNKPLSYTNENWLIKDPGKPRLMFNMSGVFRMGLDTVLIIVTGFDKKRTEHLLNYYEPKKIYIGLQKGEQYKNNILNIKKHIDTFKSFQNIEYFYIDAYSADFGYSSIEEIIIKEYDKANILASSLGPKPSSMAFFRIYKKFQNIGLVYVPVLTYNQNYSKGISEDSLFEKFK